MPSLFSIDGRVTLVTRSSGRHGRRWQGPFAKLGRWSPWGLPKKASATAFLSSFFSVLCCASQRGRTQRRTLGQREAVLVIFQLLGP